MKKKEGIFILEFLVLVIVCSFYKGLLVGLLWVILHEAAHILVSKKYDVTITGIYIHPTGARADVNGVEDLFDKQKLLLYSSGPCFNFIAAVLLFIINNYYHTTWISDSIFINIGLALFNLLPAYPLDGARIYEVIIGKKFLFKKTKNILVNISFLVSGILILLFFMTIYIHMANISLLFAAILIGYLTFLEKRNMMYIILGNLYKKRSRLERWHYIENKNISVYYKTSLVKAMSLVDKNRFNSFFVLNEGLKLLGVVYEDELIEALKIYGNISFSEYLEKKKIKN